MNPSVDTHLDAQFSKVLAMTRRALEFDGRDIRGHLFRAGLPLLFLMTVVHITTRGSLVTAPGHELFQFLIWYDYIFITFAAATFFATAITEEREEQTLGLLKLAGAGSLTILLGKWLPRMIAAILLLLVQIPLALLCITLGGLLPSQIVGAFACIAGHLVFMAGIAVLCSVCSRSSSAACGWTIGWIVTLHFAAWLLHSSPIALPAAIRDAAQLVGAFRLLTILSSGFNGPMLSLQVVLNVLAGFGFLLLSWSLFDALTTKDLPVVTQGRRSWRFWGIPGGRRPWGWQPQIWYGVFYEAGGPSLLIIRMMFHVTGSVLLCYLTSGFIGNSRLGSTLIGWGMAAIVFEGAFTAGQIFRREIANQTWSTLSMLPHTVTEILFPRVLGSTLTMLPGTFCILLGLLIWPTDLLNSIGEDEFWILLTYFTGLVLLGWQLIMLFSVSIEWSAWPISILFAAMVLTGLGFCTFGILAPSPSGGGKEIVCGLGLMMWCTPVVMYLLINSRLERKMGD